MYGLGPMIPLPGIQKIDEMMTQHQTGLSQGMPRRGRQLLFAGLVGTMLGALCALIITSFLFFIILMSI